MFVVIDWQYTTIYGPFQSKDKAEEWLAQQEIYAEQYEDQEVGILPILSTDNKLPVATY